MKNFNPPANTAVAGLKESGIWSRSAHGGGWLRTHGRSENSPWQKVATGRSEPGEVLLSGIRRTP